MRLAKQKKEEEEKIRAEEAEKKAKEAEEKRKRLEEAEKKRQAMVTAQKEKQEARGMVVEHKVGQIIGKLSCGSRLCFFMHITAAKLTNRCIILDPQMPPVNTGGHKEVTKTKAQLEEEKKVCLSLRIKPIDLEGAFNFNTAQNDNFFF